LYLFDGAQIDDLAIRLGILQLPVKEEYGALLLLCCGVTLHNFHLIKEHDLVIGDQCRGLSVLQRCKDLA
jgi:hypothetical protein